jgi:heme-degrading monooxygenase HmoA
MFARVSKYELPSGRAHEAIPAFREAIERIRALDGLDRALLLMPRDGTRAVTITLWQTELAMESSRVAASRARSAAASEVDGEVTSTEEYEVVADLTGLEPGAIQEQSVRSG